MVTLTVILLLVFVPASLAILWGLISGILSLLGLAFLITRSADARRRNF